MTQPTPVLRYLRAALGPDADGPSDAELLGRFVADRDQAAFELIVWRHAGTVLRVGRGVLRDRHAAEDVAQAAFLVLARKAGSIGRRQAVAAWLYRVAYRIAVRAARRRPAASTADLDRLPASQTDAPDTEAVRLLHDELAKLPEKYRAPLLLCFFDGLSHADAARRLGWPVGTVAGRVARAKEWLHRRLSRRGVAIPAVAAVAAEPAFVAATAQAAVAFAAGSVVVPEVSATVLELAKGAIRAMTVTKFQWAAGVLAACGALTAGGVWATAQGPGAAPSGQPPAAPAPTPPEAPPVTPLDKLDQRDGGKIVTIELLVRDIRRGKSQTRKPDDPGPDDLILSGVQSLENGDVVQVALTGAARPDWGQWKPEDSYAKYLRRKVRATGKLSAALYTGFPAFMVYEVTVDDPKKVVVDPPPAAAAPAPPPAAAAAPAPADEPKPADPTDRKATATDRVRSLNNLKQILIAIHNYHDTFGHFPTDIRDKNGKPLLSWRVAILPFIEQDALYRAFKLDEPWDSEHNKKLLAQMPVPYRAPFQPRTATETYYQGFAGPGTLFDPAARPGAAGGGPGGAPGGAGVGAPGGGGAAGIGAPSPPPAAEGGVPVPQVIQGGIRLAHIADGTSNTLAVVEAGPPVPWTKPADIPYDPKKPLPKLDGPFANVLHAAAADGAAYPLKRTIDGQVLRNLIEMNDGNVVTPLNDLRAPMPAETAEEKAALKDLIARNQKLIEEIDRLMKEHAELLGRKNQGTGDLLQAEELGMRFKQIIEELKEENRRLRGEPPVPKDVPGPKPPRKD
jgi:RNA polymerase sigma factor (sigma-70 family)